MLMREYGNPQLIGLYKECIGLERNLESANSVAIGRQAIREQVESSAFLARHRRDRFSVF